MHDLDSMYARVLNLIAGAWLVVAPFLLSFGQTSAMKNDTLVGALVIAGALLRIQSVPPRALRRMNTLLGAWLVVAPSVLHYQLASAKLNDVIVGLFVFAFSLVPTRGRPPIDRGWLTTP